jgi:hypothetical protein
LKEKIKRKPMRKRQVWNNTGNPNLPSPSPNIKALDVIDKERLVNTRTMEEVAPYGPHTFAHMH